MFLSLGRVRLRYGCCVHNTSNGEYRKSNATGQGTITLKNYCHEILVKSELAIAMVVLHLPTIYSL